MSSSYPDPSSRSAALSRRARAVFPGGSTRGQTYYRPYPIYARSGQGCRVTDVDGVERIDFLNNYTVQIFGHCHPEIVAALQRQAALGTCFTLATEAEIELAELICGRAKSFEQVRFANTGSEAVMNAIKGARAYSGRPKIAKCEGVYHGSYDYAEVSLDPDPQNWGTDVPASVGHSRGAPKGMTDDIVMLPFNDVAGSRAQLERHADALAGVLLDPVPSRCGGYPASPAYLAMLRDFTRQNGSLLILDEVVTWRLHYGGAQTLYGVEPDMTTLGKIIGGGLPIGAVAGTAEAMAVFDSSAGKAACPHSGTFTANPMSMAAGIAATRMLTQEAIDRLNALGERARDKLRAAFACAGVAGQVTGEGSLILMHLSEQPLGDYRSTYRAHTEAAAARLESLFRHLLNHGIVLSTWGMACLSTPMGEAEIDHLADAVYASLKEMETDNASAETS
jgi:glutamate-1-semialdehyde 2,1-aminomutase